MSKQIDFSQPLSAEDEVYVNDRPWLAADAAAEGYEVVGEDEPEDDEVDDRPYSDYSVEELKDFLKSRELPVSGSKEQLIERLEAADAEEA